MARESTITGRLQTLYQRNAQVRSCKLVQAIGVEGDKISDLPASQLMSAQQKVAINDILVTTKDEPTKRALVVGAPGTGKSTLLDWILWQWSSRRLWSDRYKYIFKVNLRKCMEIWRTHTYSAEELRERRLSCVIHNALYHGKNGDISPREIATILSADPAGVLLLLDGYDEVKRFLDIKEHDDERDFITELFASEPFDIILTSREYAARDIQPLYFHRVVENIGWGDNGFEEYAQYRIPDDVVREQLLDFWRESAIADACALPINGVILCALWQDAEVRNRIQHTNAMSVLYKEFIILVAKHYTNIPNITWEMVLVLPEFKTLMEIAYEGLRSQVLGLPQDDAFIAKINALPKEAKDAVLKFGLLNRYMPVGNDGKDMAPEFVHLTFQGCLTALYLKEKLLNGTEAEKRQVADLIAEHRYNPDFLKTLIFLAGFIGMERGANGKALEQRFWEIILSRRDGEIEWRQEKSKFAFLIGLLPEIGARECGIGKKYVIKQVLDYMRQHPLNEWERYVIRGTYPDEVVDYIMMLYRDTDNRPYALLSLLGRVGISKPEQTLNLVLQTMLPISIPAEGQEQEGAVDAPTTSEMSLFDIGNIMSVIGNYNPSLVVQRLQPYLRNTQWSSQAIYMLWSLKHAPEVMPEDYISYLLTNGDNLSKIYAAMLLCRDSVEINLDTITRSIEAIRPVAKDLAQEMWDTDEKISDDDDADTSSSSEDEGFITLLCYEGIGQVIGLIAKFDLIYSIKQVPTLACGISEQAMEHIGELIHGKFRRGALDAVQAAGIIDVLAVVLEQGNRLVDHDMYDAVIAILADVAKVYQYQQEVITRMKQVLNGDEYAKFVVVQLQVEYNIPILLPKDTEDLLNAIKGSDKLDPEDIALLQEKVALLAFRASPADHEFPYAINESSVRDLLDVMQEHPDLRLTDKQVNELLGLLNTKIGFFVKREICILLCQVSDRDIDKVAKALVAVLAASDSWPEGEIRAALVQLFNSAPTVVLPLLLEQYHTNERYAAHILAAVGESHRDTIGQVVRDGFSLDDAAALVKRTQLLIAIREDTTQECDAAQEVMQQDDANKDELYNAALTLAMVRKDMQPYLPKLVPLLTQLTPEQQTRLLKCLGNVQESLKGNDAMITQLIAILGSETARQDMALYGRSISFLCQIGAGREDVLLAILVQTKDVAFPYQTLEPLQALMDSVPGLLSGTITQLRDNAFYNIGSNDNAVRKQITRWLVPMLLCTPTDDDVIIQFIANYLNAREFIIRQDGICIIDNNVYHINGDEIAKLTYLTALTNALYVLNPQLRPENRPNINVGAVLRKAAIDYTTVASLVDRTLPLEKGKWHLTFIQETNKKDDSITDEYVLLECRTALGAVLLYKVYSDLSISPPMTKHPEEMKDIGFKKGLFNIPDDEHDVTQDFVISGFAIPMAGCPKLLDRFQGDKPLHDIVDELANDASLHVESLGVGRRLYSYQLLCSESQATLDLVTKADTILKALSDIKGVIDGITPDLAELKADKKTPDDEFKADPPAVRSFYLQLSMLMIGLYEAATDSVILDKPPTVPHLLDRGGVFLNNVMNIAKAVVGIVAKNVNTLAWVGPALGCAVDLAKDGYQYYQGKRLEDALTSLGINEKEAMHTVFQNMAAQITKAWRGQIAQLADDEDGATRAAKWVANRLFFGYKKRQYREQRENFFLKEDPRYRGIIERDSIDDVMEHDAYYMTLLTTEEQSLFRALLGQQLLKTHLKTADPVVKHWRAEEMFGGVDMQVAGQNYKKVKPGKKDYTPTYGPVIANNIGVAITAGYAVLPSAMQGWVNGLKVQQPVQAAPPVPQQPIAQPVVVPIPTLAQAISAKVYPYPAVLTDIQDLCTTCCHTKKVEPGLGKTDSPSRWRHRIRLEPELLRIAEYNHRPAPVTHVSGDMIFTLLQVLTQRGYDVLKYEAAVRQRLC
jgi:hypothetical protein